MSWTKSWMHGYAVTYKTLFIVAVGSGNLPPGVQAWTSSETITLVDRLFCLRDRRKVWMGLQRLLLAPFASLCMLC
jgi:hypothetical protein